jgi:tetratricopeptide (TPR) repeat protein
MLPENEPKPIVAKRTKPGRNDRCPCGSGRKYKHCCADKVRLVVDAAPTQPVTADLRAAAQLRYTERIAAEVPALFAEGIALHQAGRLADAEKIYYQILATRPDHFDSLHLLGVIFHQRGNHADAVHQIDSALKINSNSIFALNNRGVALKELKRFEEALASCDRALVLRPDYAEALSNRGNILKELNRFEEALASYDRALAVQPDYVEALSNRGLILHKLMRFEEALASYDLAVKVWPDSAGLLFNRGNVLKELKRFEEALTSYDRALTVRPDYAEALCNRGLILQELERLEEALASCDRALALQPDLAEALCNRGLILHKLKRFEQALASYDLALKVQPSYAEVLFNRGNTLKELKRFEEAVTSYERALTVRPHAPEVHNNLGVALMQLGRLSEARAAMEQAIELAPNKPNYRRNLGDITRFVTGDAHLAALEKVAEDAAALPVDDRIELHFALAKVYGDLGRHAEAFTQWLDGNALKRRQVTYSEAATLDGLDHIRAAFTSELIRTWRNFGNPSSVPIFVVGMARSGSTLVEQILASHPKVFGGGELKHFEAAVKGIRTAPGGAATFPELMSGMIGEDYRDLGARYLAETERLAPSATHITDKMPMNFMFAGLIHLALPNAPIIHTVRDPVDTCLSCFSKLFTEGQDHTYDLAELGRYYRHYQSLMAHLHRILPTGRILDVRYEDVVADLEGQARRIIAHCGLNWDPRCLDFHQTERPILTASAAQVRQPIYNYAIGRWRVHEKVLQPLLAELGVVQQ